MGSAAKILHSPGLNRHLLSLNRPLKFPSRNPNPRNAHALNLSSYHPPPRSAAPFSSLSLPSPSPLDSLLSSLSINPSPSTPDPKKGPFHLWDQALGGEDGGNVGLWGGERGKTWTVVLLGWLGSEIKHLKRYAEIYNSRGIRSVRFVVPAGDMLGLDMGRRVEERIALLASDLAKWCSETEKDGRERRFLFHTFSNAGWLTYGAILENWQSRSDIIEKIDGCVIDSGPAPELSPQVWAAGFSGALLKKRSNGNQNKLGVPDIRSSFTETITSSILEKLFSVVLILPYVNQRLSRIVSILSKDQPPCPQLYLYSSADEVIPVRSIERFMQVQKALGRNVYTHDFGSSPHVDHFRRFPHIYTDKVDGFLKESLSSAVSATV